ncbi:zinc finger protein JAGGED-like [Cajanus cajan]|uniref:zinc finger protein JAGGED-like n=1 Tax=Cajanus cajan TaxID=3821 RepID=UPI0010FB7690|nr:zinc finger protein JAGGED-like [Cajanus cajan]
MRVCVSVCGAERETETLNHARQLVYRNDHSISTQAAPQLGCCQPIALGGYPHPASNMGDPTMRLRFPRYMSGASSSLHMPTQPSLPHQHFLYASPPLPYSHAVNDYYVGHVLTSDYTCIGAPVGQAFVGGGKDRSLQEEALNWGRGHSVTPQQRLDTHSAINQF